METPLPARVPVKVVLAQEERWRLQVHSLVEGRDASDVVGELIRNYLPNYKVTIDRPRAAAI